MYAAIYNERLQHITNIENVTYSLTQRVYDPDSFICEGKSEIDINDAKLLILNDDVGNYIYACFIDNIKPVDNVREIKGLDFKTLFDIEILIDYTQPGSFSPRLSDIFKKVAQLVFNSPDATVGLIPVKVVIPDDFTDTTEIYGSLQDTYRIANAYNFLKGYIKFYEYNVATLFNVVTGEIELTFTRCFRRESLRLADFVYNLTTNSAATNKAVATVQYSPKTETDDDGNKYIIDDDGNRQPVPPRPSTLATIYYYRDKDNNIVQSNAAGNLPGRLYPVKQKMFESEYLADAQFDAVYELASSRYVDNIIIDNNAIVDPVDLSDYPLYTKIDLYYNDAFYKTLPISEKIITADAAGVNVSIKLGFKKILLTEIIKG